MIKIKRYCKTTTLMILASWAVLSCKSEKITLGTGWISFNTQVSDKTNTKAEVNELPIVLEMYNTEGDLAYAFDYLPGSKQEVADGKYTIKAYTLPKNDGAVFDTPSFEVSKNATIAPFVVTPIDLTLSLNVAKITVNFTENLLSQIKTEFRTTVINNTTNDKLVFVGNDSRVGYMSPGESYTYQLEVVQPNGKIWALVKTINAIKAADHLDILFDIDEPDNDAEPNTMVSIKINETLNEVLTAVSLDLTEVTPPTITSSTFDVDKNVEVKSGKPLPAQINLDIRGTLKIEKLIINGEKELFSSFGLTRLCDLLNMDEQTTSQFNTAGISVIRNSDTDITLQMSDLIAGLSPGETGQHIYYFNLTVIDVLMNAFEKIIAFDVTGKQVKIYEVLSIPKETGASYFEITGAWQGANCPKGATLQYRIDGSEEWITAPEAEIVKNEAAKTYYYRINAPENTTIFSRTAMVDDQGTVIDLGEEEMSASSANNLNIQNLSFDSWASSGSNWYPNEGASNSFWATGNEGVTGFGVSKNPNTIPEDTKVISGRAVKMFTYTGIAVVGVAAGNLFTGSYKTNITNPKSSVTFGRPFNGRPKGMRGYYCYQSGGNVDGAPDRCDIYILLENRDNGTKQVGFGNHQTHQNTNGKYEPFRFDVVYDATNGSLPVTHVTLVATSSYKGGDFNGASNSTLYVDEFELIY